MTERVAVIGAGVGGLASAIALATSGVSVTLFEHALHPGGKIHQVGEDAIDGGPTVFTMRWVFDRLFEQAGAHLDAYVKLSSLDVLARHGWRDGSRFDLFADIDRSADAIGSFAGAGEARRFRLFCNDTADIFHTLDAPFMAQPAPDMMTLLKGASFGDLHRTRPFTTMWRALGGYFKNPHLRQLFGRYATYCGSSPFSAPATLMLVAHVEQAGVWLVEGGMFQLASAMDRLCEKLDVSRHYGNGITKIEAPGGVVKAVIDEKGDRHAVDAIVFNGDSAALRASLFGADCASVGIDYPFQKRSLSALTWTLKAKTSGFDFHRHNVFFSDNYKREFDELFKRRQLPTQPTLYVCAQDRGDDDSVTKDSPERLLCLVNAPAVGGETPGLSEDDIERCRERTWAHIEACGAKIEWDEQAVTTTPDRFHQMFPATGGALYGPPAHGWTASFKRLGNRTAIKGLYLAGGSVHPGPGVPMAARSGCAAAASLIEDCISTPKFRPVAMPGGISTA